MPFIEIIFVNKNPSKRIVVYNTQTVFSRFEGKQDYPKESALIYSQHSA